MQLETDVEAVPRTEVIGSSRALRRADVAIAGGKGANLGELRTHCLERSDKLSCMTPRETPGGMLPW